MSFIVLYSECPLSEVPLLTGSLMEKEIEIDDVNIIRVAVP